VVFVSSLDTPRDGGVVIPHHPSFHCVYLLSHAQLSRPVTLLQERLRAVTCVPVILVGVS
jgi:hypothetical protein